MSLEAAYQLAPPKEHPWPRTNKSKVTLVGEAPESSDQEDGRKRSWLLDRQLAVRTHIGYPLLCACWHTVESSHDRLALSNKVMHVNAHPCPSTGPACDGDAVREKEVVAEVGSNARKPFLYFINIY